MHRSEEPSISKPAPSQGLPASQNWGFGQPPQPILSGMFPANIPSFATSGNYYQQQLQQQLQQHLLQRQNPQSSQLQLHEQLSQAPEQNYQALVQQQAASTQPVPLSNILQALGAQTSSQPLADPRKQQQQQPQQQPQLQPQSYLQQPQAAHSSSTLARALPVLPTQPQPASPTARLQPATQALHATQLVLTRFSGPASASFQPQGFVSRSQQPAFQPASSAPPERLRQGNPQSQQVLNHARPAEQALPLPTSAPQPVAAAPPAPKQPTAQAAPVSTSTASVSLQPAAGHAALADDIDADPQPLRPPPPGRVVWAKLARYPWWPAEVLNLSDPYIPEGEEPPRLGAVPVRFFGTYAFSWIESKRAIEPFDEEHLEHAASSRQPEFQRGVSEAKHFQLTGELPQGFTLALQQFFEEQQKAKAKSAAKGGKVTEDSKEITGKGGKKGSGKRQYDDPVAAEHARHRAVTARRLRILRHLGLSPPAGSPFAAANAACLDGFGPIAAQLGYVMPAPAIPAAAQ